ELAVAAALVDGVGPDGRTALGAFGARRGIAAGVDRTHRIADLRRVEPGRTERIAQVAGPRIGRRGLDRRQVVEAVDALVAIALLDAERHAHEAHARVA